MTQRVIQERDVFENLDASDEFIRNKTPHSTAQRAIRSYPIEISSSDLQQVTGVGRNPSLVADAGGSEGSLGHE